MAGADDDSTSRKFHSIIAAAKAARRLRRSIAPEVLEALAEIERGIRADLVNEKIFPEPGPIAAAEVPTSAPPETARRDGQSPQIDRVVRVLLKLHPPDGRVLVGVTGVAVRRRVIEYLEDERKSGHTPAHEMGLPSPGKTAVYEAMKKLGRRR